MAGKKGAGRHDHRRVSWRYVADLIDEAARLRGIHPMQVLQPGNKRTPSHARFGLVWVMRKMDIVFADISAHLGYGDSTSAYYGRVIADQLRVTNPEFRAYTDALLDFALTVRPERDAEAA